jgi:hypothetical protein
MIAWTEGEKMVNIIIDIVHFIVGFTLLYMAVRSYLKTRIPAMLYLVLGFALITFGHLSLDIYFYYNIYINSTYSELFDILGLSALIIAVKKISD